MAAPKIELIAFDMDGVLVDAQEIHRKALRRAVKEELGAKAAATLIASETILEGLPTAKKLGHLGITGDDAKRVNLRKQNYTLIEADQYPVDGYRQSMMRRLVDQGYALCCVTNSIPETAERFLVRAGLFGYLDFVVTNRQVFKPKPDPEGYLTAMMRAYKKPEETLVVEDSAVGIQAARASGAHVLETDFDRLNYFAVISAIQRAEQC